MRRPESRAGRYNIPNVGLYLWRLLSLRLTAVPLVPDPRHTGRRFRVNPLGAPLRLFRRPRAEPDISHLAEPINVPEPLAVRLMALAVKAAQASTAPAPDAVPYDDDASRKASCSCTPDAADAGSGCRDSASPTCATSSTPARTSSAGTTKPRRSPAPSAWIPRAAGSSSAHPPTARCSPASTTAPPAPSVAASTNAPRTAPPSSPSAPLPTAIRCSPSSTPSPAAAASSSTTACRYAQTPDFKIDGVTAPDAPGLTVVVTARNPARPLIAATAEVPLSIGPRGRLVLEGIVFAGAALRLAAAADDEPREIVLRDCTLVPGLSLDPTGAPASPGAPSLIVEHAFARVTLERCIAGPLLIAGDAEVTLQDCIVDAGAAEDVAYARDAAGRGPGGTLTVRQSTLVGKLHATRIELASNTLFFARLGPAPGEPWIAPLVTERRQQGCLRFSFVPPGSITPRRYRCLPDPRPPRRAAALHVAALRRSRLRPASQRHRPRHPHRRRRRQRDGRAARPVPAAARNQPARPAARVSAFRPAAGVFYAS